ncbi:hypothetical protein CAP35_09895 [Chitinophagaceae bacterium IBVUCB1]|nr:hypothetical protein CAP35_09895 [Chitinophagaceae bacterium IBVUCB1]
MAHEAHHDNHAQADAKPTTSFRSAYWFVVILVFLFVAAVNFVSVMGHDEEAGHGEHHTEAAAGHDAANHSHDATTHEAAPADSTHAAH